MASNLKHAIDRCWSEYQHLRGEGALYAAAVRVAEIADCLRVHGSNHEDAQGWLAKTESVQFSVNEIERACDEAVHRLQRLQQVVGTGSKFTYEELLFAITSRVQLELFVQFCMEHHIPCGLDPTVVDGELSALASSKQNATEFRRAQAAARKNWGMPLSSRWLRESLH